MTKCGYGPVGSFFEDFGSLVVTLLVATATILLQLFFNHRQEKLAKEKLRRDFYERRYGIWESTQELGQLLMSPEPIEDSNEFCCKGKGLLNRIESATFLLDDESLLSAVNNFREKAAGVLYRRCQKLRTTNSPGYIEPDRPIGDEALTDATIGNKAAELTGQFQKTLKINDKF